jgi:hypothetical protein
VWSKQREHKDTRSAEVEGGGGAKDTKKSAQSRHEELARTEPRHPHLSLARGRPSCAPQHETKRMRGANPSRAREIADTEAAVHPE